MAKRQQHDLLAQFHLVKKMNEALPAYDGRYPETFRRAVDSLMRDLRAEGARIVDGSQGYVITFAGVRSGSTSGAAGAVSNWIVAARRKLDRQALERMGR